jgi:type II secretory pathway pseudopilin PulG
MMKLSRSLRSDAGETLAELLIAIAILGVAIAVIAGGLGTAIFASNTHRNYATAGTIARNAAETLKDRQLAWNTSGNYSVSGSGGYNVTVAAKCWDGNYPSIGWASCPTGTDQGLQRLTVTANGHGVSESVDVIKRKN